MNSRSEQIWSTMSRELRRFIRRRVGDDDVASDILQDTFIRIHDGIDGLRDEERLAAWVYRVARNAIADHFRGTKREVRLQNDAVLGDDLPTESLNVIVGRWLHSMIASLPPRYREAIELAEGQGLSTRDVAERLGLSLSGTKSRIQRGREMLRQVLLNCCHIELDGYGNVVNYERRAPCGACDPKSAADRGH